MDMISVVLSTLLDEGLSWTRVHERLLTVEKAVSTMGAYAPEVPNDTEFVVEQQRRVMRAVLPLDGPEIPYEEMRAAIRQSRKISGRVLNDEDDLEADMVTTMFDL
jgi:hypothetical protein